MSRHGRSPEGAALLNLTGLAIGYLYLGRRRRAAAHLAGTAALVAAAFASGAAADPWQWRIVGGYWLAWQAVDAWWLAAAAPRRNARPVLTGLMLVAAVVAGLAGYGAAGRAAYAEGRAAQADGDCATAMDRYDQVTGPFELTLSTTVAKAAAARDLCREFVTATVFARLGDPAEAVDRFHALLDEHPFEPLAPTVATRLTGTYLAWARKHRDAMEFVPAIDVYRTLLADRAARPDRPLVRAELAGTYFAEAQSRADIETVLGNLSLIVSEFGDTPVAAKVPAAVAEAFTAADQAASSCAALPSLDRFAALDQKLTATIANPLNASRARATMQCAVDEFNAGRYTEAVPLFEAFLAAYPGDGAAAQAHSALISARIAAESLFPLPMPPPYSGNTPGDINVTFFNDSTKETHVLLAGPTAHEFVLPACGGCPTEYGPGEETCPTTAGRPAVNLRLSAGMYYFITLTDPASDVAALSDTLAVTPFFDHTMCLFVQRR